MASKKMTLKKQSKIAQWNKMLDALQRTGTLQDETLRYHINAARRLYAAESPTKNRKDIPSRCSFMNVLKRYRLYGSVVALRKPRRAPVRDALHAAIAEHLKTDPTQSMRALAKLLNVSRESVRIIANSIKRSQQDEQQIQTPKVEKH